MFYDEQSNYLNQLPERLQGIVEVNAIAGSVDFEIDKLSAAVKKAVNNKFPSTADEDGCARWEKILSLSAPLNGTLQARRDAIRAKIITKPPINLMVLKSIVEAYMGLEVDVSLDGYQVHIKYRGESRIADLNPLYATMWKTIPANMLVDIAYLYTIWDELDAQSLTFDELDAKNLTMNAFEKGEWIS
ncbi:DUF2313 domain-containing protein [Caproiciproducens sp. NJN-50]|uniref:putative phage tail protein n=1 Tax=Caproiciproducens sp. NJN-50 TaxID=2507162 RepID=UPI000FFE218F|nr:putative phage tail protein [Caproiciproducens sp. NJN-50]QAT48598.1 DUF2313 domain-containing protein [Caproiciproducens sp. NJN-50]